MADHPTLSLELYESEQRFRLLVQGVRDYAIYMLDVDGRITNWNIGAELIKGYKADEIVGHNFSRFYTEEDRAGGEPARALAVALSEGKYENEAQRVRKDGTRFWAHVVIDPIHDESGEHVGFAKITRDITARRESDLALLQAREDTEAHLRSILATVPDAMVVIDEKARILSFSVAAEKMFGYVEAEVLGKNVKLLMPPPDRDQHDGYLGHYLRTGERKVIGIGRLTNARHRDGNLFPIELLIGEAGLGERRIFTGFIRDLTERRETELRLQDLQSELAHVRRVSEISTLATSLAHELNQPLTAIANYAEGAQMLLDRFPHDETVSKLSGMLEASAAQALRAGEIVRRLREFMSHGRTAYSSENLQQLVTEANALALVGTREHGIEVEIDLDPTAERVLADRIQIQQVLVNLIRNGIDAMIAGPRRRLRIASRQDGDFVRVSVEDSGSGIDESVATRLFQPFITSKQSGMGVGLSICRTIVEAHRGKIWFEPVPTGGTIFRFTLPTAE